ncbi:class I SAM-dependent methyltransferase [Candidatus Viridilinea mediisalina]|uniref:SAM-dependent methyltransferase n=1 Tax=Candidatus Viridilinea mediisalina TaxID=2024553 RepID=A0A2A6RKN8_9CHLR|nr:class I SAM-dependent methyltransferase [Candidatus Viridilinea mediisalina]PDW03481.1 SAM-dependent methyltransferase [Candidatus Viridilinea mediisalina]
MKQLPELHLLTPPPWSEYTLLATGQGMKLERFGPYTLIRPETQAIWPSTLPASAWQQADASFEKSRGGDESPGSWMFHRSLPEQWQLHHDNLAFWVRLTPFRHTGVFPEHCAHWPWLKRQMTTRREPTCLVLFGYTGLSSLYALSCGARVTHVDASKPALRWAQDNQQLSGLMDRPIRWLVDDVGKFVAREIRRGSRYDLILLDPPVFGRGPKGEIWRLHEQMSHLVAQCVQLLSERPLGLLLSAYATNMSALTLYNVLTSAFDGRLGTTSAGELTLAEAQSSRLLPAALYACWSPSFHPHEC